MKFVSQSELLGKLNLILKPEKSFYLISIVYGIGISILSLAIPISVQSLVNTVTFTILNQPLVILSLVLLSLLLFSGILNALQTYIIELFQQRFYARTTSEIAIKLINSNHKELVKKNGVDLTNKYFDVMTVQKNVASLLTGGIAIFLQTIVGLILLAFYHPYFLAFDILLIFLLLMVWILFRKKAIATAIDESKAKYDAAGWLKELARTNLIFKTRNQKKEAIHTSDKLISQYLTNRMYHFKQVFYQEIMLLTIYAIMSALILGLGGFLVMEGELTLGQLVAAELIATLILGNFSKAAKYLQSFYDLYAAVDKIYKVYALSSEDNLPDPKYEFTNYDLSFRKVELVMGRFSYKFDFTFKHENKYFVCSKYNSTRLVFVELLRNVIEMQKGHIKLGNYDMSEVSPLDVRDIVHVIDSPQFFEGTIIDNLTIGNPSVTRAQALDALEKVGLDVIIDNFEHGMDTKILLSGYPFWSTQLLRLELARCILLKPKVIVITETIDQVDDTGREIILNHLTDLESTLIVFSHKPANDLKFNSYLSFEGDQIKEFSTEKEMRDAKGASNE